MRLLAANYLRDSNTTIDIGTESNNFPLENLISNTLREKTKLNDTINIDFLEPREVDCFSFAGNVSAIIVRAGSTSSTLDYSEQIDLITDPTKVNVHYFDAPLTYRYWRIDLFNGADAVRSPIPYSSFTDGSLNSPGNFTSSSNLVPAISGNDESQINFGFYLGGGYKGWGSFNDSFPSEGGTHNYLYTTEQFEGTPPTGVFINSLRDFGFNNIASSSFNGEQVFTLPKNANEDTEGGTLPYRFDSAGWSYAVNLGKIPFSQWGELEVYQNNSVYRRTYVDGSGLSNDPVLAVRWDGQLGPAGSATPDVTEDSFNVEGDVDNSNIYANYVYLGKKIQLPKLSPLEVPKKQRTDSIQFTQAGAGVPTAGTRYRTLDVTFPLPTYTQFKEVDDYIDTFDRVNGNIVHMFEDRTDIEPFFGFLSEDTYLNRRDRFTYWPFNLAFREGK